VAPIEEVLFDVLTPLEFRVRVTRDRWEVVSKVEHPVMATREEHIRAALESPDEVRRSRKDSTVLLFYRAEAPKRWTCAVIKQTAAGGFLITAYPTDAIKEGMSIWPK
jgi:hypothetical protein